MERSPKEMVEAAMRPNAASRTVTGFLRKYGCVVRHAEGDVSIQPDPASLLLEFLDQERAGIIMAHGQRALSKVTQPELANMLTSTCVERVLSL